MRGLKIVNDLENYLGPTRRTIIRLRRQLWVIIQLRKYSVSNNIQQIFLLWNVIAYETKKYNSMKFHEGSSLGISSQNSELELCRKLRSPLLPFPVTVPSLFYKVNHIPMYANDLPAFLYLLPPKHTPQNISFARSLFCVLLTLNRRDRILHTPLCLVPFHLNFCLWDSSLSCLWLVQFSMEM